MALSTNDTEEWIGPLDTDLKAPDLAAKAAYSPAQFYRLVRKSLSGSPMAIRRRLLLERAAYELTRTKRSVTEIAFDAAYGSLEGFGRAFRRVYRVSPSEYRRLAPTDYRYGPTDSLHYAPTEGPGKGVTRMHTDELMIEHHVRHLGQILDKVASWTDDDLDRPMRADEPFPWCEPGTTYRKMIGKACGFAAPWMHAISGIETSYSPHTVAEMRQGLEAGKTWFLELLSSVERDRSWDLTFVDSVCEPPEVFSYGGVIGHVLTHNAYRRYVLVSELRALGYKDLSYTDPLSLRS